MEDAGEVWVLVGGDPVDPEALPLVPDDVRVVAADGGLALAGPIGLRVDAVVGDLDSVDDAALAAVRADGAEVVRHPVAKDATDLELAVELALEHRPARLTVVGGAGGRLDHELAVWALLTSPVTTAVAVRAVSARARVDVVRPGAATVFHGPPGELVSLVPWHGDAHGVTTDGLVFPLDREPLPAGTSRGVSNRFVDGPDAGGGRVRATVSLTDGVLVAIRPSPRRPTTPGSHPCPDG